MIETLTKIIALYGNPEKILLLDLMILLYVRIPCIELFLNIYDIEILHY